MGKRAPLFIILGLAIFFRFFYLTKSPPSLNWDEVSIGYNAYSVLKTGKDEWGKFLPLAFSAFGETKLPGMIYASIPGITLFGLTDFGVRVTPAVIGVLAVLVLYLLTKEILGIKFAYAASFLLAISPWHVHLSRASFEAGLALLFVMLTIYAFYRGLKKSNWFYLSAVFAALAMYSYNSARILLPLLIPLLLVLNWHAFKKNLKIVLSAGLLGALLMLPAVKDLSSSNALLRFNTLNYAANKSFIDGIGESRRYTPLPDPLPRLIHNKYTHYVHRFFTNYLKSFGSEFLFFAGDRYTQRSSQEMGLLYFFELPLLIFGLVKIWGNKWFARILVPWILLAPIPSAITIDAPSALRGLSALPPLLIVESVGLVKFLPIILKKKLFTIISTAFVVWNIGYFCYREFGAYPIKYSSAWGYGYKDAVIEMMKYYDEVDQIYITTKQGEPYIYTLFYGGFDPSKFQHDSNLKKSVDSVGWTHVDAFDKIKFVDFHSEFYKPSEILKREKGEILFVAGFAELGELPRIKSITAPNWVVMFEIAKVEGRRE